MRPRRCAGTAQRELADGEAVVLGPDGLAAVVLNPLGAAIWELCEGQHDVEQLVALVGEAFPAEDPQRVRADVAAFLEQLVTAGLVEDAACGASSSRP